MKANEFVKKYGWDAIKHDLSGYFKDEKIGTIQVLTHEKEYMEVNGDDLKRLVESHELVEKSGGVESAKKELQRQSILRWISPETERLREAIADVESCQ